MNSWRLIYDRFEPKQEKLRESLCTLGNGFFAIRGASAESVADDVHYPGTYLAGGYNRLKTEIAGRVVENEDLVNLPNALFWAFRIDGGEWFNLFRVDILEFRQVLDMRHGVLERRIRFADALDRRTELRERRLVHHRYQHLAAQEMVLVPDNWSGPVEVMSALDGRVANTGVSRYQEFNNIHLEILEAEEEDAETILLKVRTTQSRLTVALAARTRCWMADGECHPLREVKTEAGRIGHSFILNANRGDPLRFEKVAALYTTRDHAISEPGCEAVQSVSRADDFGGLLKTQMLAWRHLWRRFDIGIEETEATDAEQNLRTLRLHIFHLLQTVSMHSMDRDVGIPARGWHGEAYRGHIFWDELFIFPLLNLRVPEMTRALLKYRYRRLEEARAAARGIGLSGAMFPWQSGSNGREESQETHLNPRSGRWIPDHSRLQRHVNAAIAFNVWQYFQVSRDMEFMNFFGAELILEIARFWADIATWNEDRQRYEIRGVMGPDEYHDAYPDAGEPGLDNNAYTNIMAVWVLCRALELLDIISENRRKELCEVLRLRPEELEKWEKISRRMFIPFQDGDIISQFEGYEDLEELDWEAYRKKHGKVMRLDRILEAEGDTPNRYKASKQADVLMLFYLFSSEELAELFSRLEYPFEYQTIPRNIDYYLDRTSHGSTLSQVVHAWVTARSDRSGSWSLFCEALQSDIADIQGGTTSEGIHLGAMAGTVDLIQRCFTGLQTFGDCLHFNPSLPDAVSKVWLNLRYRGQNLRIDLTQDKIVIACEKSDRDPIRVAVGDQVSEMKGGQRREFRLP